MTEDDWSLCCEEAEYKGQYCQCAGCRHVDGVCVDHESGGGCYECDGIVTDCDLTEVALELSNGG